MFSSYRTRSQSSQSTPDSDTSEGLSQDELRLSNPFETEAPPKRRPSSSALSEPEDDRQPDNDASLLVQLRADRSATRTVRHWLSGYLHGEQRRQHTDRLVRLLADCSGAAPDALLSGGQPSAARGSWPPVSALFAKGRDGLAESTFRAFWSQLIVAGESAGALLSSDLLDTLIDWQVRLSAAAPAPLRYVATLAALESMTALLHCLRRVDEQMEALHGASRTARQRLEQLRGGRDDLEQAAERLFAGIFEKRYRDSEPRVRALCIDFYAAWLSDAQASSAFLADVRTRYVGWALNDRHRSVRKAAALALQRMFARRAHRAAVQDFLARFAARLLQLPFDRDAAVAVEAVAAVALLCRFSAEHVQPADLAQLYPLLTDANAAIRQAAAQLASAVYFTADRDDSDTWQRQPSDADVLRKLLVFLVEYCPDAAPCQHAVVDALWLTTTTTTDEDDNNNNNSPSSVAHALRNPSAMIDLLLADAHDATLTDREAELLARLLLHVLRKLHDNGHHLYTVKRFAALLRRHQSDVRLLELLVQLPGAVDLTGAVEAPRLQQLVDALGEVFQKHAGRSFHAHCAAAWRALLGSERTAAVVEVQLESLLVQLRARFERAEQDAQDAALTSGRSDAALAAVVSRMDALMSFVDISCWGRTSVVVEFERDETEARLVTSLLDVLRFNDDGDDLALSAAGFLCKHLMWTVAELRASSSPSLLDGKLAERKQRVVAALLACLGDDGPLQHAAFCWLSDLAVVFNALPQLRGLGVRDAWTPIERHWQALAPHRRAAYVRPFARAVAFGGWPCRLGAALLQLLPCRGEPDQHAAVVDMLHAVRSRTGRDDELVLPALRAVAGQLPDSDAEQRGRLLDTAAAVAASYAGVFTDDGPAELRRSFVRVFVALLEEALAEAPARFDQLPAVLPCLDRLPATLAALVADKARAVLDAQHYRHDGQPALDELWRRLQAPRDADQPARRQSPRKPPTPKKPTPAKRARPQLHFGDETPRKSARLQAKPRRSLCEELSDQDDNIEDDIED